MEYSDKKGKYNELRVEISDNKERYLHFLWNSFEIMYIQI